MPRKTIARFIALIFLPPCTAYSAENQPLQLDSVVVIGKQAFINVDDSLAGSVDVITRDELEYEHVTDTLELYTKTPGVVLSRYKPRRYQRRYFYPWVCWRRLHPPC